MNIPFECINIWQEIQQTSQDFENHLLPIFRKQTGSYYTSLDFALSMMEEMIAALSAKERQSVFQKKFLEPCVGTGHFVFAYLMVCKTLGFNLKEYQQLLDNIYVCDINAAALKVYRKNLCTLVKALFGIELNEQYFKTHIGQGVLFDVKDSSPKYIPLSNNFAQNIIGTGFDFVVTNPPYKNLKAEKTHYKNNAEYVADKARYEAIGKAAELYFKYSIKGGLNLYKFFVEEIITRYLKPLGRCYLLMPSSILSDKTCSSLRTKLFQENGIISLRICPENIGFVNASQALCAILLQKGSKTGLVSLHNYLSKEQKTTKKIAIEDMIDSENGNALCVLSENEYKIRKQMLKHPRIKDLSYIHNVRGELDLTLNKQYITSEKTKYRLIRGRDIFYYKLASSEKKLFVLLHFFQNTSKFRYIQQDRIACQQIANLTKARRIQFAFIPRNHVLGNSCNFISVDKNEEGVNLWFLLGVLNSSLINWYFKLTSSNNHVNNYEIANFPLPISTTYKTDIERLAKQYMDNPTEQLLQEIDSLVYRAYGVTRMDPNEKTEGVSSKDSISTRLKNDLRAIIPDVTEQDCSQILDNKASIIDIIFQKKPYITSFERTVLEKIEYKYKHLYNGYLLNHTTFKLSNLDLEMIHSVPPGGNWKFIPAETVQKSKRLLRLTQTGGRTTLYGRIDYAQPSYTITTYFNRPGNGTYVHPTKERVLSVREAARFQTFPDNYYFVGNKTDLLKQVGNAVPVALAYSIAKKIIEKVDCHSSIDLFSGAGGMTYGFKLAGIKSAICNDIEQSACLTLKVNSPEIPVICGDITNRLIKDQIIREGIKAKADIICGGPPCQGFSLAGLRNRYDTRNQLFVPFIDIVSAIKPKVVVFENVEGLLSFQGGTTYHNIIDLFSKLGYFVEGRTLWANHFGVPQKRKRVIVIATRKDLGVLPAVLYPSTITEEEKSQITARDTIYDLETIPCGEEVPYKSHYSSKILNYFNGRVTLEEFLHSVGNKQVKCS